MATTQQENAALVRRFLTDVVAGGDIDAVDGFLAPDVVNRHLVFGGASGPETVTALGWRVLAAADVDISLEDTVAANGRVAILASVAGDHRESLMDLAPTGHPFEIAYAWFCHIEDGQIAEIRSLPDGLGLMRQLNAIPERMSNRSLIHQTDET